MIVGTRWLYAVQRHRSLGGFVGFIVSHCVFLNSILAWYSLQSIGCVYCLRIASLTQSDETAGMNFYPNFLCRHWLV